jgi:hypothetical protein
LSFLFLFIFFLAGVCHHVCVEMKVARNQNDIGLGHNVGAALFMAHAIVCTMQPDLSLLLVKRRFVKPGSIVRVVPQQPNCNLGQRENVKLKYTPPVVFQWLLLRRLSIHSD